jgi:C-terminal processing protease CtpA/Prc
MRLVAVLLAFVLTLTPLSGSAQSNSRDTRDTALVALCHLWNAVRFFHPSLTSETDAAWDDALLAAIPKIESDPSALHNAAQQMLATLGDLGTSLPMERPDGAVALPNAVDSAGIRIVRLRGYPTSANDSQFESTLSAALKVPTVDHGLIVDLRIGGPASVDQLSRLSDAWERIAFAGGLIQVPIAVAPIASRASLGLPDETGRVSLYSEYRDAKATPSWIAPAPDAVNIPVAFVADRAAVIPPAALALLDAGRAALFSSDGTPGLLPGDDAAIDAGDGLIAFIRISGPLHVPMLFHGGVEDAAHWMATPGHSFVATAPPIVPIGQRFASTDLPDEPHRILAAFRMWGAIEYFNPYKELMRDDWDAALAEALPSLRASKSSIEYELALRRMYAHVHDTHAYLQGPAIAQAYSGTPGFLAREVQGQLTIVRADAAASARDGFRVGDVIESIDGELVPTRLARLRPYISASTEQSMTEVLATGVSAPSLLAGPIGSSVTLQIRRAGGQSQVIRALRESPKYALWERGGAVTEVLPGNVGYVDLARLKITEVDAMVARMAPTRAIIFDLRGYPHETIWSIAPHLAARTTVTAVFAALDRHQPIGVSGWPSDDARLESRSGLTVVVPAAPRLRQPIVCIIDARAISQTEYSAMILRATTRARFVGEPTAGADGDITTFYLPGGITASFSGQAVFTTDYHQTQRIGILPDVHVSQTLVGVREGRDELLSAALGEALTDSHASSASISQILRVERAREIAAANAPVPPAPLPMVAGPSAAALPTAAMASMNAKYDGGIDSAIRHTTGHAIFLRANPTATTSDFGAYLEQLSASDYRGKRVRISGYLRTSQAQLAGFWMRIDGPGGVREGFDNMLDRGLTGTRDWTPFSLVLDVPPDAVSMVTGLILVGQGTVWGDDLRIDVVGPNIPTTGR